MFWQKLQIEAKLSASKFILSSIGHLVRIQRLLTRQDFKMNLKNAWLSLAYNLRKQKEMVVGITHKL